MTPATELHNDDDISNQEVFKNDLEESGNSGGLYGGAVGGAFGAQIYFLIFWIRGFDTPRNIYLPFSPGYIQARLSDELSVAWDQSFLVQSQSIDK
jgi:hypothetical protein